MDSARLNSLWIARNIAFAAAGAALAGFAVAVLLGVLGGLRLAIWSVATSGALFAIIFVIAAIAGKRGYLILWDEAVQTDYVRSLQWAYAVAFFLIFPGLGVAIFAGLDPLRGFIASPLLIGAIQLLIFSILDRLGR